MPGEAGTAATLLRAARGLIMVDVTVVLVAVGALLLHFGTHQPEKMWGSGEGVQQDPEGVSLQAPDGYSYGDNQLWGAFEQHQLVEELRSVRRSAGLLPGRG